MGNVKDLQTHQTVQSLLGEDFYMVDSQVQRNEPFQRTESPRRYFQDFVVAQMGVQQDWEQLEFFARYYD